MSSFYSIDSTRVSHREYWWGNRSPLVLIAWILKWLHVPLPNSTDDPNTESTYPFIRDSLPPETLARFQPIISTLEHLGFVEPVYHVIQDPAISTTIYWLTMRHSSGQHFARIQHRIWHQAQKHDRGTFVQFFTSLMDGTFAVSSSAKPDLEAPPTVCMLRRRGLDPLRLWDEHQQFTAKFGQEIYPGQTPEDTLYAIERLHVLLRDFHLARKVFRPRNEAEQASAEAFSARFAEASASGSQYPEVLAELDRLQTAKPGWGNTAVILVISVIAFLAIGAANWDWKFTLLLIPILFIHESGHWLAMKIFGYRNLRMFFIPLFGAAVTGKNWNVPGWKKALVYLAGPVPGILLGCVLTVAGLITKNTFLNEAALVTLLLNGINLLPFLPLDGGRVLHATLFCRNRYLDVAFQIAAIGGLLLLFLTGSGRLMIGLIVFMIISLPVAIKVAKVTDTMRKTPLPPPMPGEDRIPVSTAEAIIAALKAVLPAKTSNKILAQHTLNVFESINAKPPGALGTLGLLAVHGGSVVLVLVCGILLILDKHGGGISNFAREALTQPQHVYPCDSGRSWAGASLAANGARNTIVTTFLKREQAEKAFENLQTRLPATSALTLAGDSLLLSLPAEDDKAREKWFDAMQERSTNTFVALSNETVMASFFCIAPDQRLAKDLVNELDEYLRMAYLPNLVAPWSTEAIGAEWEKQKKARQAWAAIGSEMNGTWTNAELKVFATQIRTALRRGAKADLERLQKEQAAKQKELEAKCYQDLKAKGLDPELLDLHLKISTLSFTNQAERASVLGLVAARLGQPRGDGKTGRPRQDVASSGHALQQGLLVKVNYLGFKNPSDGIPAFAEWLCSKGCKDLKYGFHSFRSDAFNDADDK